MSRLWGKIRIQLCRAICVTEWELHSEMASRENFNPPCTLSTQCKWDRPLEELAKWLEFVFVLHLPPLRCSSITVPCPFTVTHLSPSVAVLHPIYPHKQLPHLSEVIIHINSPPAIISSAITIIYTTPNPSEFWPQSSLKDKAMSLTNVYYFPYDLICRGFILIKKMSTTYLIFLIVEFQEVQPSDVKFHRMMYWGIRGGHKGTMYCWKWLSEVGLNAD